MAKVRSTTVETLRNALKDLPAKDIVYPQNYTGDLIILKKGDIISGAVQREANFKVFSFDEERLKGYPE